MKAKREKKIISEWKSAQKRGIVKHSLFVGGIFALILNLLSFDWDNLYLFNEQTFVIKFMAKFLFEMIAFGLFSWYYAKYQYNNLIINKQKEENL